MVLQGEESIGDVEGCRGLGDEYRSQVPGGGGPEADGLSTTLLGIFKGLDRVGLGRVWGWGTAHGMPPRLLRVVLVTYAMSRRIPFLGSVRVATRTRTVSCTHLTLSTASLG